MCVELWRYPAARSALERLSAVMGDDLEAITTRMPAEELLLTFHAQRAIHAHHVGHWLAFRAAHPEAELAGAIGHSVGVVAALVAAEALSVEDSGFFVLERARAFADVCAKLPEPSLAAVLDRLTLRAPRVPVFMGTSGRSETDPDRIRRLLAEQPSTRERHLDAVRASYAAGCRVYLEVAARPQPIHWLSDQLVDEAGAALSGVTTLALTTEDLVRPILDG